MVRRLVETRLDLEEGYLDQPNRKAIIKASIRDILNGVDKATSKQSPKRGPKKSPANSRLMDKSSDMSEVEDDGPPLKKRKSIAKPKTLASPKSKARKPSQDDTPKKKSAPAQAKISSDDSMSEVEDDGPLIKKQKSLSKSTNQPRNKTKKDPKAEEKRITRLKSLVFKCGVRKKWQSEFEDCPTPKSQIARLKQILVDLGMEGGFSVDKAEKIREEREFKADVEAIQQNGVMESERETRSSRPVKKASPRSKVATAPTMDFSFLGDQSESDSD